MLYSLVVIFLFNLDVFVWIQHFWDLSLNCVLLKIMFPVAVKFTYTKLQDHWYCKTTRDISVIVVVDVCHWVCILIGNHRHESFAFKLSTR